MRLIEEHELDAVTGANTQQEIVDFVERVLRDMQQTVLQDPIAG